MDFDTIEINLVFQKISLGHSLQRRTACKTAEAMEKKNWENQKNAGNNK